MLTQFTAMKVEDPMLSALLQDVLRARGGA
jgi:hypothetical protein